MFCLRQLLLSFNPIPYSHLQSVLHLLINFLNQILFFNLYLFSQLLILYFEVLRYLFSVISFTGYKILTLVDTFFCKLQSLKQK